MTNKELLNTLKEEQKNMKNGSIIAALERKEKKKLMFSNYDYINWLVEFTANNYSFIAYDSDYQYLKFEEKDDQNLKDFYLFFDGIEEYASDNYIYPKNSPYGGVYYQIKYNGVGFDIGIETGQGTACYCDRTTPNEEFIDFVDIVQGKKLLRKEYISNELDRVYAEIDNLIEEGIPFNIVISELQKINSQRNNYTRKRTK